MNGTIGKYVSDDLMNHRRSGYLIAIEKNCQSKAINSFIMNIPGYIFLEKHDTRSHSL
jgi:hypothetical protein